MSNKRNNSTIEITIPEGITFSIPLASPIIRSCAAIVDILLIGACNIIATKIVAILFFISTDIAGFAVIIFQFILSTGYGIATEWFMNGQTFGKRFFHIRVIDSSGLPLQPYQVILRNLPRPVDQLPLFYLAGGLTCFFSRHFQRLSDHLANTVVIIACIDSFDQLPELASKKYNSLLQTPHLAARIRQTITPEQRVIASDALARVSELVPQARIDIFRTIANMFKTQCSIPSEFTDGIPNEVLVTNIVEVLYANKKINID